MQVLRGGTRRLESDEKRNRRVRRLMSQYDTSGFSTLSSDIFVADYPLPLLQSTRQVQFAIQDALRLTDANCGT